MFFCYFKLISFSSQNLMVNSMNRLSTIMPRKSIIKVISFSKISRIYLFSIPYVSLIFTRNLIFFSLISRTKILLFVVVRSMLLLSALHLPIKKVRIDFSFNPNKQFAFFFLLNRFRLSRSFPNDLSNVYFSE